MREAENDADVTFVLGACVHVSALVGDTTTPASADRIENVVPIAASGRAHMFVRDDWMLWPQSPVVSVQKTAM